jgi:hypothetical protein
MKLVYCNLCAGSGKVMGNGCIIIECDQCDGYGKYHEKEEVKHQEFDRENAHYKEAITRIKELNTDLSEEEAEDIFNEALDNLNQEDKSCDSPLIKGIDNPKNSDEVNQKDVNHAKKKR